MEVLHLVCIQHAQVGNGRANVAPTLCVALYLMCIERLRAHAPATEAESSMCSSEGMPFHSANASLSSNISLSSVLTSFDTITNSA